MSGNKEAAWVRVQVKAFTQWINSTLEQGGLEERVNDLDTDFQDGLILCKFFDLLHEDDPFPKYIQKPKLKVHKLENIGKAFTFMEGPMGMRNPGIQAEDVLDINEKTNVKLVLGMIWTLFRKYRIAVISQDDKSSEEGLLQWVKDTTENYENVTIDRWKNSFNDGMAFLALVHRFDPSRAGFKYEDFDPSNAKKNLETAFQVAEDKMGVPRLLEIDDFLDNAVDERALVLYTSLLFHAYNNAVDREAIEAEEKRRAAELEAEKERKARLTEENEKLRSRVVELEEELKAVTVERDELSEKDSYLEEKVDLMKQVVEQQIEERDELVATRDKLLAEIDDLEKRLEIELETKKQGEAEMGGKLEEELARVSELEDTFGKLQSEASDYKGQVEDLEGQLDEQRRRKKAALDQLEKDAEFSESQMTYLGIFKKNLEDHLVDLGKWGSYLEYDKKGTLEFDVDVRGPMLEEFEDQDFQGQLDSLKEKFDAETAAMAEVLKSKQIEAEQEKLQKGGGKSSRGKKKGKK